MCLEVGRQVRQETVILPLCAHGPLDYCGPGSKSQDAETLLRCRGEAEPLWEASGIIQPCGMLKHGWASGEAAEEPGGGGRCGQNFMALENGYCIYQ